MHKIQQRMADLFKEMEGIRLTAEKEARSMTAADIKRRSEIKTEIDALSKELDSVNEERDLRGQLYGDAGSNALTRGGGDTLDMRFGSSIAHDRRGEAAKKKDYRSLFGIGKDQSLDRGGFQDFNEFLNILHSGRSDDRMKIESRAMSTGTPSSGGFVLPEDFAAWLLDASLETEIIRPRATVWPMTTMEKRCPGWDMSNHSGSVFGGLTAEWLAENGTATEVFAKLRQILLKAKKLACYTSASNELVADGVSFEAQLESALIKTIGFYLDYAFIQGTGAGQPLGLLNDPALITVTPESGQSDYTVQYENCVKMFARLAPQCAANAIWVANQTLIPQLMTLTIAVGTGGAFIPAVQQANGKFYLLTKEIVFTEKCPALGAKGDLMLADISQYSIGLRKEVSLDKSNAPGWLKDESSYRAILRADGQGTWDKAITPVHGDTLSWCVALAERTP
jgi:HK97 family phage major capsid protein